MESSADASTTSSTDVLQSVPWIIDYAPIFGFLLLFLMVLLVVWRAVTRQPTTVAEVSIGIIGLIAFLIPILENFSFEGLGVKATAKLINVAETSELTATRVAEIEARVKALESARNQARPAAQEQDDRTENARAQSSYAVAEVTTVIFYQSARRDEAERIRDQLLQRGYPASIVATDFTEIPEPLASGVVRILYTESGRAELPLVQDVAESIVGQDRVIVSPRPSYLKNGQLQLQLF